MVTVSVVPRFDLGMSDSLVLFPEQPLMGFYL
jgi:hypothetical protein